MISKSLIDPDSICSARLPLMITLVSATSMPVIKCNQCFNIKNIQCSLVKENTQEGSK